MFIYIAAATLGLVVGFIYVLIVKIERRKIQTQLEDISVISFDLTGSAEQVSTVSTDLFASSQEQIDTLSSTVSASHQISSMILKTSDNAKDLKKNTVDLHTMSDEGKNIVQKMVESSLEIKEGSESFKGQMQESINELSNALLVIQEIADKTKLINEIVFQTKLLSFNASVEAARAGEHGKGFAIVALEIGKLAEVSGKSSLEIAQIVERSVESVNTALAKTKKKVETLTNTTSERSQMGYNHAKNCEIIFNTITEKISTINMMVKEISTATNDQAQGVEQLDHAIENLQEAADRNKLVASQSTEHAHSFESQARELIKITDDMKLMLPKNSQKKPKLKQFVWSNKLMLGVDVMDKEHKILVEKINNLVTSLEGQYQKKNKLELMAAFTELANYTSEHFDHEEKFMKSMNYQQYPSHKKIHEKLLGQVTQYGRQIENETINDQMLISFLRNWLISHIMGVDMQYANEYTHSHQTNFKKAN